MQLCHGNHGHRCQAPELREAVEQCHTHMQLCHLTLKRARHDPLGYCQLELPTTAARKNPAMIKPSVVEPISYAGYRFPPEVISYAVWLYFRFPLSLRMVEEMLAARSIDVTYETLR
jgi:hypothetical protein